MHLNVRITAPLQANNYHTEVNLTFITLTISKVTLHASGRSPYVIGERQFKQNLSPFVMSHNYPSRPSGVIRRFGTR
jgi:hypothetical protein